MQTGPCPHAWQLYLQRNAAKPDPQSRHSETDIHIRFCSRIRWLYHYQQLGQNARPTNLWAASPSPWGIFLLKMLLAIFTSATLTVAVTAEMMGMAVPNEPPTIKGRIIIPNSSAYHSVYNPGFVTTKTGALLVFAEARRIGHDQDHIDLVA